MNFACISVDRMIAISKPLYHRTLPPSCSLRIIAFIWFLAFALALLYGLTDRNMPDPTTPRSIYIIFSFGFVIPTICTMVSYAIITRVVLFSPKPNLETTHHQLQANRIRQTVRITWKILLVILPGFIMWSFFWIPIFTQNTDKNVQFSHSVLVVIGTVPILAAAINPVIYLLMTTEFRKNLVRLLMSLKC